MLKKKYIIINTEQNKVAHTHTHTHKTIWYLAARLVLFCWAGPTEQDGPAILMAI